MKPLRDLAQAWWREGLDTGNDDLCHCAMKLWDAIDDAQQGIAQFMAGKAVVT